MKSLSLSGSWQFRQVKSPTEISSGNSAPPGAAIMPDTTVPPGTTVPLVTTVTHWHPATVPGSVHTDLLSLDMIPDPFVGDNEKKVQWVAESDWEYQRTFDMPIELLEEEKIYLVCDGLDTLANVFINEVSVGETDNMFRQYRWEIKHVLKPGENSIRIFFASPVQYCRLKQEQIPLNGVSQAIPGGPHLRKAPCQFGWDWGPQLPPTGIWKDLYLEGYSTARIEDIHLRQHHRDGVVNLTCRLALDIWQKEQLSASLNVTDPQGKTVKTHLDHFESKDGSLQLEIEKPQLWWPNDLGEQPLYEIDVCLMNLNGKTLDKRSYRLGLRQFELRQQPDEWGKSWQFVVNGVPIFAKGSNWIPADSFPTRITDKHLEHLIKSAADSHQNMLRVWGGGVYEEDRFYDLCDRYGILVWQEFAFSCSVYPLDQDNFIANVQQEAVDNIRRLRHRTSLILWCGNNEMEWGWVSWGWNNPDMQGLRLAYDRFFHQTLPGWVAEHDPDTPYWPSSPSSGIPFENPNGEDQGDSHYWDVWHGRKPFTAYRTTFPRFQSEFGFQSLPPLETIKTYAQPEDWNMTSYIMEHHQRSWNGNGLMISQMTDAFRMPKDFDALVYLSLVLQAEGIRYGVEHWRRQTPRVAGALYWQLNDCWPVASWSSLDYFGRWKALHYLARRFFAPILLSIEDHGKLMSIHVTNDTINAFYGTASWRLDTIDGQTITAGEDTILAPALTSVLVDTLDFNNIVDDSNFREVVFICDLMFGENRLSSALITFAPNKHLKMANPGLKTVVRLKGSDIHIEVSAQSLARFVELSLDSADVVFSDNFFDIPAGKKVTVTCPLPSGWDHSATRKALKVRSLFDSFA